jgi:hypothetical protein
MTTSNTTTIRNFLYMNVPLLYSIYSQVFEGITNQFIQETIIQAITSNTEGIPVLPSRNETKSSDTSRRVENGILHDHMYNRLEEKLETSLLNSSNLNKDNLIANFSQNPLVKTTGRAEIEDYELLRVYLSRFNEFAQIIAYASKSRNEGHRQKILEITEKLALPTNAGHKKQLQSELEKLTNAISEARQANLLQDQHLLDNLATFAEAFNPDGYEVLISPEGSEFQYRGVLERDWLRLSPQQVSSLYGGQSVTPWTMVGIVTYVPGAYTPHQQLQLNSSPSNPMMLDAYRNLFRSSRFFERMFLESNNSIEIILTPIAVYREFKL